MSLARVPLNRTVVVTRVQHVGQLGQRLMEMGVVEGARVEVLRRAPLGDPLFVRVGDYDLSLRHEDAAQIEIAAA
jgi:Fe2+ transport system protein FeoA